MENKKLVDLGVEEVYNTVNPWIRKFYEVKMTRPGFFNYLVSEKESIPLLPMEGGKEVFEKVLEKMLEENDYEKILEYTKEVIKGLPEKVLLEHGRFKRFILDEKERMKRIEKNPW